jgi:hypothetical protein
VCLEVIGKSQAEWQLWTDDGEIDAFVPCHQGQRGEVAGIRTNGPRKGRDARVSRTTHDFLDAWF